MSSHFGGAIEQYFAVIWKDGIIQLKRDSTQNKESQILIL